MTLFRPCIDLHDGQVKQIVGGTLSDSGAAPHTHFVSDRNPAWYAMRYRDDELAGGHVIRLGPGNDQAAEAALAAWPGGLRLGGGVDEGNAQRWIDAGAAAVIVTSWLFVDGRLSVQRVRDLARQIGPERLVVDLSCREVDGVYRVATNRWQTVTETAVEAETLNALAEHCSGFLIHAASREGLQGGIDESLVSLLGEATPLPCTYAGGGRSIEDLNRVDALSEGRVDLVFGSALDLFGGQGVRYADCVAWNRDRDQSLR
ncbi:MAG: phosphoribosylformimino-5-aminoimidazole carboxamide ribotide isomerase [Myxococcota bacterium]|nr:phosphoribosylformimino-5-aminoimidazole carboxamide ribotide isomerase [Myxococcota bacterium]